MWTSSRVDIVRCGHHSVWTSFGVDIVRCGHRSVWTSFGVDIVRCGHRSVWTSFGVDIIRCGHRKQGLSGGRSDRLPFADRATLHPQRSCGSCRRSGTSIPCCRSGCNSGIRKPLSQRGKDRHAQIAARRHLGPGQAGMTEGGMQRDGFERGIQTSETPQEQITALPRSVMKYTDLRVARRELEAERLTTVLPRRARGAIW